MRGQIVLPGAWVDVSDRYPELVFAARHRGTGCFVELASTPPQRDGFKPAHKSQPQHRRVVRPSPHDSAYVEHCETYHVESASDALDDTREWIDDHPEGLPEVLTS